MTPTLKLGPWDSPAIEFMLSDIEPLVILLLQTSDKMNAAEMDSVWSFAQLDTLHLNERSVGFFMKLEDVCRRVLEAELTQYDVIQLKKSEFADYLGRSIGDGLIAPGAKAAAQRFLEFLAANPNYWPPLFPASSLSA